MKKSIFIISLALIFFGCQSTEQTDTSEISDNLSYFKDSRTGLCFAAINSNTKDGWEVISITCVPCDSVPELRSK